MDWRTNTTKLIVAFRNYTNAPKNEYDIKKECFTSRLIYFLIFIDAGAAWYLFSSLFYCFIYLVDIQDKIN